MFRRLVIAGLVLAGIHGAFAAADSVEARDGRHAAFVLDANTGAVLHAEDGDAIRHPASLTKMMTLYLTFETVEAGRLSMSDKLAISARAASQAPSKLDLDPGATLTVGEAIRALITKSANDVAVALAEKIGGSEANFAKLMNKRAREIGMTNTNFENASGLPNDDQVTTARDMVTLGLRLQDDFPTYYPLFATRAFAFQGKSYRNHNTLLRTFQGIDGIKTGYTRASGFNLVSSVRRGSRHVIGAVFGGSSAATRNAEMRRLLTRALARASSVKTRKPRPQFIAKLKSPPRIARRAAPPPQRAQIAEARMARSDAKAIMGVAAQAGDVPKFAAAAQPAPQAPDPAVQAVAPQPLAEAPVDAGPPIDVFKVKRVLVSPRSPPKAEDMTDMAASDTDADGLPDAGVQPAAFQVAGQVAADPERETVISKTSPGAPRLPSTLGRQMAMLGAQDAIAAHLAALPDLPDTAAPAAAATGSVAEGAGSQGASAQGSAASDRGRAPSSLQAQSERLSQPQQPARVAALRPDVGAAAVRSGHYEIQIGAYRSIADAQNALHATQAKAAALLAGYASITQPVTVGGKQFFRARYAGFDANGAARACTELRRQSVDCFVMTSE